ncbi:Glycerophosphodiester phosphodiesterase GDE1 [Spathaspora sp. JA1]|nr:Glycerophosphodiester phosphodiesterase GDE1 [Spathaspora sp. JA1]
MKFGKIFQAQLIPEWSIYYMNYKALKKLIKLITDRQPEANPEIVSETLACFFFEIDRDIEQVDSFYNTKFQEYNRRLDRVIKFDSSAHIESSDELDEIVSILVELRSSFKNLQWFAELNHKGFIKILKKLDKKLTSIMNYSDSSNFGVNNKEAYLSTRINALPFANGVELKNSLETINHILMQLGGDAIKSPRGDITTTSPTTGTGATTGEDLVSVFNDLVIHDEDISDALVKYSSKLSNRFLLLLLNKAGLANSTKCIDKILQQISALGYSLFDDSEINGRNFFHQHIISLGKDTTNASTNGNDRGAKKQYGLSYILKQIDVSQRHLLMSRDQYSRTPLHYVAKYNLPQVTAILVDYLKAWNLIDVSKSIDDIEIWGDQESLTPLHIAIIGKHSTTVETLIKFNHPKKLTCPDLLLLSVRLNSCQILDCLIQEGNIDVDFTDADHNGETALYIACKLNLPDLVQFLLDHNANSEIGEYVFGWTPIFVAASEGYLSIVKLLKEYGARYDIVDDSSWFPVEHASLRGYLQVADLLIPANQELLLYDSHHQERNLARISSGSMSPVMMHQVNSSGSSIDRLTSQHRETVEQLYQHLKSGTSVSSNNTMMKPVKSFGHRYLTQDESILLVTLGTTDLRDDSPPIELNKNLIDQKMSFDFNPTLSLLITCRSKLTNEPVEPPVAVDLPIENHHGSATDPITFKLTEGLKSNDVVLTFDLAPTYQTQHDKSILARATAILGDVYTKVGPSELKSLHRGITIPLIDHNLNIMGKVKFEYLEVGNFTHPSMSLTRSDTYWKQLVSTRVIGHRGLGKNQSERKSLQLGENTVESFVAAASLGASYVEFDVQLTKDYVPVIYHDFTVAESGVDIPMHLLTSEQFLGLNKKHGNKQRSAVDDSVVPTTGRPQRAKSSQQLQSNGFSKLDYDSDIEREFADHTHQRMKLTRTWKNNAFKGNARGLSIASSFVTLRELFHKVPANVGFDIELKYPMLDEAEQEGMGEISLDLNHYLDVILQVIYDENNIMKRDIIFSSFHPDVCILLSLKQPTIPILFLTESGTTPMADIRASSLQNAIRFAKKWNLLGIVSAAAVFVKTPRLAEVVKSSGLVCVTYGEENNQPESAKVQMKAGVDAVIVDSVLAVREGLRVEVDTINDRDL